MKTNINLSLFLLAALSVFSLENQASTSLEPVLWQTISSNNKTSEKTPNSHKGRLSPQIMEGDLHGEQRHLKLDESALASLVHRSSSLKNSVLPINIPLPDGQNIVVTLHPEQTLSPELQHQFPEIHTWKITSDNPDVISGRAELTELGFHAMLRMENGDQLLIEPEQPSTLPSERSYRSFSKREHIANKPRTFSCGTKTGSAAMKWRHQTQTTTNKAQTFAQRPGKTLLTYDLAISATGEYTQQFGGSQSAAYSAIVTTVNRLNEIFEQELGLKFNLVSGTETVFTNPNTDPFSNGFADTAAEQNQNVLDTIIGSNRYDIGHVLGVEIGGNGLAYVAVICRNGLKARGYSASGSPGSNSFIVDFVAHEIGHQLGATHTYNTTHSACSSGRVATTAYEPGSGSSIMSYAGLCGSDDIQPHVDPQFHTHSIRQMRAITHDGSAAACATNNTLSNNLPQVNAGINRIVPARTPFVLSGSASDSDGDKLLYGWDQVDSGKASSMGTDTGDNALIKSSELSHTGLRTVPDIKRLLTMTQSFSTGESLPKSNRNMDFRLTVRDGKGSTESDDIRLTIRDTGESFKVISPTNSLSSGNHEIVWNVANTHLAPINCNAVDIAYTNNQGATFTDLILNTPNDGSENVQLSARAQYIRVKCSNNIFFALSATSPHIASYSENSGQSSNNASSTDNSGGGGTIPLQLLFIGGLFATLLVWRRLNTSGQRASLKGNE